jgi:hypothetical protein
VLSTLDLTTREVEVNVGPAMAVGSDPILRHFGTELFIINRGENNITILDDQSLAFKEQIGTGPNSNPQDVAVVGNKLYVPTYGNAGVTVLRRGSVETPVIDLSADDPDKVPNCSSAYAVGAEIYVSCQLLDGFAAVRPSKVYVIDSATDKLVPERTLTLLHKNPIGLFERIPPGAPHAGDLVTTTVEDFVAPGCVERFAPAPGATPTCMVTSTNLRGFASRVEFDVASSITFFAVNTGFLAGDLVAYDMPTDSLWDGSINAATQEIGDVAVCPKDELVVSDITKDANGLRIFNSNGAELTRAPLPIGKPPISSHGVVCY